MSGRDVSVFVFPHGSIDDVWKGKDVNSQGVTEYHSEITCEPLPANTTLYMPNILGKPYHLKTKNLEDLIRDKTREWSGTVPFSEYIASKLDEYESKERNTMFELMDECDRSDAVGYAKQQKMPDEQREQRVKLRTSMEYKTGIKWLKPDYYIVQKRCNLPGNHRPGEGLIICIEEENKQIRKYYSTGNEIHGRYNLTELLSALKDLRTLGLKPEDKICVFDFVCNIPNFVSNPNKIAEKYNDVELLSFNHDHDGGATMTYGAIPISQSCLDKTVRGGVSFDDTPLSLLTVGTYSPSPSPSPSRSLSASASPARPLPLFYVKVPPAGIKLINFEVIKTKHDRSRSASPVPDMKIKPPIEFVGRSISPKGGKRKHTKRKHSLKRSNRKRRVTRRRYNKKKR
jgi:hypothetical protein